MKTNLFLYFTIFAAVMNRQVLYTAFGFNDSKPILIGFLVILQYLIAPYNEVNTDDHVTCIFSSLHQLPIYFQKAYIISDDRLVASFRISSRRVCKASSKSRIPKGRSDQAAQRQLVVSRFRLVVLNMALFASAAARALGSARQNRINANKLESLVIE